jgi:hypothetical protein
LIYLELFYGTNKSKSLTKNLTKGPNGGIKPKLNLMWLLIEKCKAVNMQNNISKWWFPLSSYIAINLVFNCQALDEAKYPSSLHIMMQFILMKEAMHIVWEQKMLARVNQHPTDEVQTSKLCRMDRHGVQTGNTFSLYYHPIANHGG